MDFKGRRYLVSPELAASPGSGVRPFHGQRLHSHECGRRFGRFHKWRELDARSLDQWHLGQFRSRGLWKWPLCWRGIGLAEHGRTDLDLEGWRPLVADF